MSKFLKKSMCTEKSAKNKETAIEAALNELEVSREQVDIEVLDEGSKGFLGLGARDARVKVTIKPEFIKKEAPKPKAVSKPKNTAPKPQNTVKQKKISADGKPEEEARKFLSDIFSAMNLEVNIDIKINSQSMKINLSGDNMGIIIGKRGDTLDSLQYLTSLVVNQHSGDYVKVSIDTENYREKRTEALITLSSRLADKVTRTSKKFTLEPMNPYERRIIHASLQDSETVTTYSVGSEPYRKVVIAPKNAKPYKKDGFKKRSPKADQSDKPVAEKTGEGYTTTYKADFKPPQRKAEYKNFEDYLAGHSDEFGSEENE